MVPKPLLQAMLLLPTHAAPAAHAGYGAAVYAVQALLGRTCPAFDVDLCRQARLKLRNAAVLHGVLAEACTSGQGVRLGHQCRRPTRSSASVVVMKTRNLGVCRTPLFKCARIAWCKLVMMSGSTNAICRARPGAADQARLQDLCC